MVRSPSGVTSTRQRAVDGPSDSAGVVKLTPWLRIDRVNEAPSWSSWTLPT